MAKRVVLAYSGGLDTSVAVTWLQEELGLEVVAVAVDVGQGGDFEVIRQRALGAGAVESVPDEFVRSGEIELVDLPAEGLRLRIVEDDMPAPSCASH